MEFPCSVTGSIKTERSFSPTWTVDQAERLKLLGLPPDGLQELESCLSLLRFVSDGILPNSFGLTKIYQWCREDMNKLKCLARLQNQYTPKVSLIFRLANVENPDNSLRMWAEAGLHVGFHVDLGDEEGIQALADHLPLGSCSIRILVLNSNETYGQFHFDKLANTIRLNESVAELSVCGPLSKTEPS